MFVGVNYKISMDFFSNPQDPQGAYWKLVAVDPQAGSMASVVGDETGGIDVTNVDPSVYPQMWSCIQGCAEGDYGCLVACIDSAGLTPMGVFTVSVTLYNPTDATIEFILPAGLIFVPDDSAVQPMLLLETQVVSVPPGYITLVLPTYCLDHGGAVPESIDGYSLQSGPAPGCLAEIVSLLQDRDLNMEQQSLLQEIIWDCMEYGGISGQDWDTIYSML